ncbi:MAG: xanthine dehydrogenase family protein molybdopterin-binding subunit [Chloroflexi bacterium]|nr:MAG: xanthine dehydrogenase family protein molybdopterin-binding subunit [Chloroflexota bacterium]
MSTNGVSKVIGTSVKRREDRRLITGAGKYTADVQLNNMLFMAVLRSPHPSARILNLDLNISRAAPGVVAVLGGKDINSKCQGEFPLSGVQPHMKAKSRFPMAEEVVRYEGEPVAVVLADNAYSAIDALELIAVDFDILPAVVDVEAALEDESPLVHEELGTNLCVHSAKSAGDPNRAFKDAHGVVSLRLEQPRLVPNPMEARAVVASYESGTGDLTLWLSTQAPHQERGFVADVLGFPEHKLRVISVDVGGGFGCKIDTYPETVIAAILAIDLTLPVRWVEERQEEFTSTIHGRGEIQYVQAAYAADGVLLGMRLDFYTDLGAYCFGGTHAVADILTPSGASGAYQVEHLEWNTNGVYTNKMSVGPYRGYGQHATAYVVERVMDRIAAEVGLDPAEVRRRNFIPDGSFPYRTVTGREHDSGAYSETLDRALTLAGYQQLRQEQHKEGGLMGIGLATTVDASGFGPSSALSVRPGYESATVRVGPTGGVTVLTGSSPHGQGHETTFAQIASDELGVPLDDIKVLYGDTHLVPHGTGTRASRSLVVGGSAVVKASRQIVEKATGLAAALLNTDAEHVELQNGIFVCEDIPDRQVTWLEVASVAYGSQPPPNGIERGLEVSTFWEPTGYTYPFTAALAVVRINRDTGSVMLDKFISVNDCGTVINPMVVLGQIHGGLAQGIGAALLEEAVWSESGQLLTGSFMDYAMPLAIHLPDFTVELVETPSPHNFLGAKGIGESPTIVAVPAVVNAVVDALAHLGVSHLDIPLTPEKVWKAINSGPEARG